MALDFVDLTIDASGFITVPNDVFVSRAVKGTELTWNEHDAAHRDAMIRNFNLLPNTGTADTLTQILGGHTGSHVLLRPKNAGDVITIADSATLRLSTGTLVLSEVWHCVIFVCLGANFYAKATI